MSEWNAKPIVRRDLDRPNEITIEVEFVEVEVDEDAILEALAEAEVLEVDRHRVSAERTLVMYFTPWKEAK